MGNGSLVACFDVGGSSVKAGLADPHTGEVRSFTVGLEFDNESAETFAAGLPGAVEKLLEGLSGESIGGVGISVAALTREGVVVEAPNLKWYDAPLADLAKDALARAGLDIPVAVENDADCFTLGEWRFGEVRGEGSVLGITLGTGVGGGFVTGGRIFKGGLGFGLEPGHSKLDFEKHPGSCGCGADFCLEAGVGAAGIIATYRMKGGELPDDGTVGDIAERAHSGEETAILTFRRVGRRLGMGLAGLANLLNPNAIVIGGGVSKARRLVEPSLVSILEKESLSSIRSQCKLFWSTLLERANLLGAALAAVDSEAK